MTVNVLRAAAVVPFLILASAAYGQAAPALFGENLVTPVPKDFKLGSQHSQGPFTQMEYVAQTETVNDWSVMVTVNIVKGQLPVTPEQYSQGIANGFRQSCAKGEGHKLLDGTVNGYAYTQWMMTCDLNPNTNKPEFMLMRTVQGADAFFNVQYAFRSAPSDEAIKAATDYLDTTTVCDTRIPAQACK